MLLQEGEVSHSMDIFFAILYILVSITPNEVVIGYTQALHR